MSGWKPIATAPKDEQILGLWQYFYHGDRNPTQGYSLGEVNKDGQFVDHEGEHSNLFTHWYDFGDGKPMPDAPEVE